jgi:hypothetical protein
MLLLLPASVNFLLLHTQLKQLCLKLQALISQTKLDGHGGQVAPALAIHDHEPGKTVNLLYRCAQCPSGVLIILLPKLGY